MSSGIMMMHKYKL